MWDEGLVINGCSWSLDTSLGLDWSDSTFPILLLVNLTTCSKAVPMTFWNKNILIKNLRWRATQVKI